MNNHALIKTSKVHGNTKPHVNKILRKEIMKRSNLKNIANKSGIIGDKKRYKIQRNVVIKLNKKLKKAYFKEKLPKRIFVNLILLTRVFVTMRKKFLLKKRKF